MESESEASDAPPVIHGAKARKPKPRKKSQGSLHKLHAVLRSNLSNLSSVWHRQDSQGDPKKPVESDEGSSSRHEDSGKPIIAITVANYGPVDYNEDRAATSTSVDDLSADISPDTTVEEWLMCMPDLRQYIANFVKYGYDNIAFISGMTEQDLEAIGIDVRGHRNKLKRRITKLPKRDIEEGIPTDVKQWLVELGLGEYWPYFLNNSYTEPNDLEDLKRIDKEQLKTDFKVRKVAHINMLCQAIKKLQYANKAYEVTREKFSNLDEAARGFMAGFAAATVDQCFSLSVTLYKLSLKKRMLEDKMPIWYESTSSPGPSLLAIFKMADAREKREGPGDEVGYEYNLVPRALSSRYFQNGGRSREDPGVGWSRVSKNLGEEDKVGIEARKSPSNGSNSGRFSRRNSNPIAICLRRDVNG
ncbi:hypothetical protein QZH41_007435 [Actinostola sp. cb2023]|nr:hypothetical protein QZH41_007435 [Actinostola sp. cb2023]